jgi:hypothetical protein
MIAAFAACNTKSHNINCVFSSVKVTLIAVVFTAVTFKTKNYKTVNKNLLLQFYVLHR